MVRALDYQSKVHGLKSLVAPRMPTQNVNPKIVQIFESEKFMENSFYHLHDIYFEAPNKHGLCNLCCWKIFEIYLALESDVVKIMN